MTDPALLNALFVSTTEGLILADVDGIITRVNTTASELLEIPPESILGQPETHLTRVYADLVPLFEGKVETVTIKGKGAIVVERYPLTLRRSVLEDGRRLLRVAVDVEQVHQKILQNLAAYQREEQTMLVPLRGMADFLVIGRYAR